MSEQLLNNPRTRQSFTGSGSGSGSSSAPGATNNNTSRPGSVASPRPQPGQSKIPTGRLYGTSELAKNDDDK